MTDLVVVKVCHCTVWQGPPPARGHNHSQ